MFLRSSKYKCGSDYDYKGTHDAFADNDDDDDDVDMDPGDVDDDDNGDVVVNVDPGDVDDEGEEGNNYDAVKGYDYKGHGDALDAAHDTCGCQRSQTSNQVDEK